MRVLVALVPSLWAYSTTVFKPRSEKHKMHFCHRAFEGFCVLKDQWRCTYETTSPPSCDWMIQVQALHPKCISAGDYTLCSTQSPKFIPTRAYRLLAIHPQRLKFCSTRKPRGHDANRPRLGHFTSRASCSTVRTQALLRFRTSSRTATPRRAPSPYFHSPNQRHSRYRNPVPCNPG